jgi:hypothetical protein
VPRIALHDWQFSEVYQDYVALRVEIPRPRVQDFQRTILMATLLGVPPHCRSARLTFHVRERQTDAASRFGVFARVVYHVPRPESSGEARGRDAVIRQEFRPVKGLCRAETQGRESPFAYEVAVTQSEVGELPDPIQPRVQSASPTEEGRNGQALLFAPARRGPWGVVTSLAGPPSLPFDSASPHTTALRQADGLLRHGMVLLAKTPSAEPGRVFRVLRARKLFRQALEVLRRSVGDLHPLVAYAYDRIGFAQQEWGDLREAERMYLRAVAIRDIGGWVPTVWDELTFINLAILYGQQGRHALRDAMVERSRSAAAWVKGRRSSGWRTAGRGYLS